MFIHISFIFSIFVNLFQTFLDLIHIKVSWDFFSKFNTKKGTKVI